jgi:PD-(D/E)XK nuclease superfamily
VPLLPIDEILKITRSGMRQEFRESREGRYRLNPRIHRGFFEHEYDVDVANNEWKESADMIDHCLRNFYASDVFDRFKQTDPSYFLEVEEFSSIYLDGVEILMKLDCATRDGSKIVIWDWKTGKREADTGLSLQLGCYGYYAKTQFRVDLSQVEARRFDLYRDKLYKDSLTGASLEEILDYVRGSIKDMHGLLDDVTLNRANEERFRKVARSNVCLKCNFFKVCKPDL